MINVNNSKLSSNSYQMPLKQDYQVKSLLVNNNDEKTDSVSFSGKDSNSKKKNSNRTIVYVLGGLALAGTIIFAVVKLRKGKPSSVDVGKKIEKGIEDLEEKVSKNSISSSANKGGSSKTTGSSSSLGSNSGTDSSFSSRSDLDVSDKKRALAEELQSKNKEAAELQQQAEKLQAEIAEQEKMNAEKANLETELEKLKAEIKQSDIDHVIKAIQPENEQVAREVLPKLFEHSDKLGIVERDKDFVAHYKALENYLRQITPKNKNFAIMDGIPLLARNMEEIKATVKDPENAHELLGVLSGENYCYLDTLLNLLTKSKTDKVKDIVSVLQKSTRDNGDIIFYLKQKPETYKITKIADVDGYLSGIKPENIDFAFKEVMPLVLEHNDRLKLNSAITLATVLGHITPETKDVIKLVADNAKKLQLDDLSLSYLLSAITPQNKAAIAALANNAKKFELVGFWPDDYKELLDLGQEGIIKRVNRQ